MFKDFESWCPLKAVISSSKTNNLFHDREIWWCSFGVNVGDEEDGKGNKFARPVLILKKLGKNIFVGIPLSSKTKESYLYCNFTFKETQQSAIIGQIRTLDSKRLIKKMGRLQKEEFNKIKEAFSKLVL